MRLRSGHGVRIGVCKEGELGPQKGLIEGEVFLGAQSAAKRVEGVAQRAAKRQATSARVAAERLQAESAYTAVTSKLARRMPFARPGSAVEQALLISHAQDEIDAWAREWSESGRTIPKGLKKACKQLKIKKGDLQEWLELAAIGRANEQALKPTGQQLGAQTQSLRRSQTMGTRTMRAELGTLACQSRRNGDFGM